MSFLTTNSAPRRICLAGLAILCFGLVLIPRATGQKPPGGPPSAPVQGGGNGGVANNGVGLSLEMNAKGSIVVRVLGPNSAPLKQQAFVRLYKIGSGVPLRGALTEGASQVGFDYLPGVGWYSVEVSAAGYETQRKEFNVSDNVAFFEVEVTMKPVTDDAASSYTRLPRLPSKAQKHVEKGIAEFGAGDFKGAEKELTAAYKAAPKSSETSYLLGTLYLRTKDLPQAEKYFAKATAIDPGDSPALVGLAHVQYQKNDLKDATELLERALTLNRKQWEALWLLSEIHYRQHDFEKARKEAADAVELGREAAAPAEFVEALALGELGRTEEALQMLRTFLRDAPSDINASTARELAARLEMEMKSSPAAETELAVAGNPLLPAGSAVPKLPISYWEPAGVDDEKLPVADGVACPVEQVIREAGRRATEFVDSVNRIQAREDVVHEELSTLGRPLSTEKRKFDYLVSITDSDSGLPSIDEDRRGDFGPGHFPGPLSMFGLADLPLIFLPNLQSDFQMSCEGLGKWEDRATWVVYFRQRPDRPERIRSYELLDGSSYTAGLKGRAWIAADTYQIVRLEANLMKPIPQIGLGSEEDVIEYGPVPFQTKNTVLWLPTSADIYFYYRHRPFHRHHEFRNYQLFSVSASQKIGQPVTPPEKENP